MHAEECRRSRKKAGAESWNVSLFWGFSWTVGVGETPAIFSEVCLVTAVPVQSVQEGEAPAGRGGERHLNLQQAGAGGQGDEGDDAPLAVSPLEANVTGRALTPNGHGVEGLGEEVVMQLNGPDP